MLNFVTLGSKVVDDAIVLNKDNNRLRVVRNNPFTIGMHELNILPKELLKEDLAYSDKMKKIDISNSFINEANKCDAEYVVIDFLGAWNSFVKITLESGKDIRISHKDYYESKKNEIVSNIERELGSKVQLIETINPMEWNDDQLEREVQRLVESLSINLSKKMIVLECYLPYHICNKEEIIPDIEIVRVGELNDFLRRIYHFIQCNQIKIIPDVVRYCSIEENKEREFAKYVSEYLVYISEAMHCIYKNENIEIVKRKYQNTLQTRIDRLMIRQLYEQYKSCGDDRKIVLISTEEMSRELLSFEKDIANKIAYEDDKQDLSIQLEQLKVNNQNVCIFLPHIYNGSNTLKSLYKLDFLYRKDVYVPKVKTVSLTQFTGIYDDIFYNHVEIEKTAILNLNGVGNDIIINASDKLIYSLSMGVTDDCIVRIGDQIGADKLSIGLNAGNELSIGAGTTFADNCYMRAPILSNIRIGRDCMFSSKVFVCAGDGHSIYRQEDETLINFNPQLIDSSRMTVELDEHVWVGYEVVLLARTRIGKSSIVGARSLVVSEFPNNCIIAGDPAKMIKKDITWSREPCVTNAYADNAGIDKEYLKYTEDIK